MCKIRNKCCDNPLQGKLRVLKPNMAVVYFDQQTDVSQGGGLSKSSLRHLNCFHIFFLFYERANLTGMLIFTVDGFQVQSITDENNDTALLLQSGSVFYEGSKQTSALYTSTELYFQWTVI